MLKHTLLLTALFAWAATTAQNVGIGTTNPAASAQLEVSSTNKGFLMPRMTTAQRNSIFSPATGLTIYNLDDNCTDSWNGSQWIKTCGASQTLDTLPAWVQKFSFPGTGRARASGFSIGNKGYLGLGQNVAISFKDFWEFDPSGNIWTQKADFQGEGRHFAVGFSIGNKGYFGTGATQSNVRLKDFWEYDPATNQWTQKQDFGGSGRNQATGFSIGNKGYIGMGIGMGTLKDFWEYDPATNQWTQKQDFGGTSRYAAVGFSIGNKGYTGTGSANGIFFKDFWEYNPAIDEWTQKQDFGGLPRSNGTGFGIQGKGYIGTGFNGNFFNDFWEYDTTGNQWTQKPNFGGAARGGTVGFSIGDKGYIGTGNANGTNSNDFWEYNPFPVKASFSPSAAVVNALQYNDGSWTRKSDSLFTSSLQTRVGIGTASPTARLDVIGTTKTTGLQLTTAAAAGFLLQSDAAGNASWVNPNAVYVSEIDPKVGINTVNYLSKWNGAALVSSSVIENGDNIGIGISTPAQRLDVAGGIKASTTLTAGGLTTAGIVTNTAAGLLGTTSIIPVANGGTGTATAFTAGSLVFAGVSGLYSQNNAHLFWNNTNQRLGIGTLSPTNKLTVSGPGGILSSTTNNGSGTADWIAGNFGAPTGNRVVMGLLNGQATIGAHNSDLTTWANLLINPDGGNVGIGTNAPTAKLSVNGTANNPAGAWAVFSDARIKTLNGNFTDGLNVINNIQTIWFSYNSNAPFSSSDRQIGVVAQELEKIAPYMVTKSKTVSFNDLREINNQAYTFLLINAVKELSKQNEAMQAETEKIKAAYEEKLHAIEAKLNALLKTTASDK